MRRIVVTGMGAVSPLGCGTEIAWQRLLAGWSGLRRLPDAIVETLPAKVAGIVPSKAEDAEGGFDPDAVIAPKDQRKMDPVRAGRGRGGAGAGRLAAAERGRA